MNKEQILEYLNPSDWVENGKMLMSTRGKMPEICAVCGKSPVEKKTFTYLTFGFCEQHKDCNIAISDSGISIFRWNGVKTETMRKF